MSWGEQEASHKGPFKKSLKGGEEGKTLIFVGEGAKRSEGGEG